MPKKGSAKKMAETLLSLHDMCIPETSPQINADGAGYQRKIYDPVPAIKAFEERIEKNFELTKAREHHAPPLLHICVQYCGEVVQSRYEKSVFSSLIHEADNIMDKVTGDEDDSDFESLIEVEDDGSTVFDGLGLTQSQGSPELRILIVKVTDTNKIWDEKIDDAKAVVTYQSGNKRSVEKTKRRAPNYRHVINFNHVFIFRGASIDQLRKSDIKLSIKAYSSRSNAEAFVILSDGRCATKEGVDPCGMKDVVTDPLFWKKYLDNRSEGLFRYAVPLVCPNATLDMKRHPSRPSTISLTPSPTPREDNPSPERSSSSSSSPSYNSSGTDQELAALKSESPEIQIVITETGESEPNIAEPEVTAGSSRQASRSPTPFRPSPTPSPIRRSPSPFDRPKSGARKSSSDSVNSKSDRRKKKKFSMDKFTKLFS